MDSCVDLGYNHIGPDHLMRVWPFFASTADEILVSNMDDQQTPYSWDAVALTSVDGKIAVANVISFLVEPGFHLSGTH